MGAKEVIATAPIVVLLYDRAFLAGSFRETFRRRGALYVGLAASWAVFGAMLLLYKGSGAAGFGISMVTPWQYALTQPGVILHYLRLSFWPQPLCLDYSWPFATAFRQAAPEVIALAALLAATGWAAVRRPAAGFLGAWFFLILAPTSSVMPIKDACFEHRMYLSLAAVVAGAVIAGYALLRRLAGNSSGIGRGHPGAGGRGARWAAPLSGATRITGVRSRSGRTRPASGRRIPAPGAASARLTSTPAATMKRPAPATRLSGLEPDFPPALQYPWPRLRGGWPVERGDRGVRQGHRVEVGLRRRLQQPRLRLGEDRPVDRGHPRITTRRSR